MLEIIKTFQKDHPDKELLFLMISGSHFFNLNTPSSDLDFRGIYISRSGTDCLNDEVEYKTNKTKEKNSSLDVDVNLYSLKKYLNLLGRGDFNMMEILYAPEDKILFSSTIFKELQNLRSGLLVNDITSFLGFISKEYKRYGIDSNHLGIQQKFLCFLKTLPETDRLIKHWDKVEAYESDPQNFLKLSETKNVNSTIKTIIIAKRTYHATCQISTIKEEITEGISKYGARRKAQALSGVEFKGLYHAQRLLYEAFDLIDYGGFKFPFTKERHDYLLSIKDGTIHPEILFKGIDEDKNSL